MRKLFLALLLLSPLGLLAQQSGELVYNIKVDIHKHMTGERAKWKEMVPRYKEHKKKLVFNEEATLYINLPKEVKSDMEASKGGFRMMMAGGNPDNRYYVDRKTNIVTDQRDFMDKMFLIIDTLENSFKWKITGNQKVIEGYPCISAEYKDSLGTTEAWFTPKIKLQAGPSEFGFLPGLIMEMSIADSSQVVTLDEITLREIEKDELEKPKKGKKVTKTEFNAIRDEKIKEMREMYGKGGGKVMISH